MTEKNEGKLSMMKYALKCAAAGGTSGILLDAIFYPLDTFKNYIQASQTNVRVKERFLKGSLYSGFSCTLAISIPYNASFFLVYEYACAYLLSKHKELSSNLVFGSSAALAELVAITIDTPAEVIRQNTQFLNYKRPIDAARGIWATRGFKGFFAGYTPTLLKAIPYSIIQLTLYEYIQKRFFKREKSDIRNKDFYIISMGSGAISSITAAILTNPFDVIKTRMMTNTTKKFNIGAFQWVTETIKGEGLAGLFKGSLLRIIFSGFGGAFYFLIYATAFKYLGASQLYQQIRK